jgi:hypothetical protein
LISSKLGLAAGIGTLYHGKNEKLKVRKVYSVENRTLANKELPDNHSPIPPNLLYIISILL